MAMVGYSADSVSASASMHLFRWLSPSRPSSSWRHRASSVSVITTSVCNTLWSTNWDPVQPTAQLQTDIMPQFSRSIFLYTYFIHILNDIIDIISRTA